MSRAQADPSSGKPASAGKVMQTCNTIGMVTGVEPFKGSGCFSSAIEAQAWTCPLLCRDDRKRAAEEDASDDDRGKKSKKKSRR